MRQSRLSLYIIAILIAFAPRLSAQTQLPADVTDKIDKMATDTLRSTGVPSASIAIVKDGQIVYVKAYGDARLEPKTRGDAADALQHRLDQQAVHGGGDAALAGAGQAFARRQGREVHSRSHARERSDDPPTAVAHVGLPGLLAAGLRDADDAPAGHGAEDYGHVGAKPLDFEPGTKWQYSNTNYVIAGVIIEKVARHAAAASFCRKRFSRRSA